MPGAGNTDACLHPRRVPGPGKPGRRFVNFVSVRLRMPGAGNTGACLHLGCVPGLGKPAATCLQQHLLSGAPLLRHHCAHANSAPLAPRLHGDFLDTGHPDSTSTPAFFARLSRPRLHHTRSRLHRQTAQRATACLSNLIGFHSSHDSVMRRPLRLWGGVRRLAFGFFSSLTVCVATIVIAGGCGVT